MKNRYYFRSDDCSCWKIDAHLDYMKEHGLKVMNVYLAERETNAPHFFCRHFQEVGEKGDCGRHCKAYQPRNGVSGVCKHYGYTYSQTDKVIRLTP